MSRKFPSGGSAVDLDEGHMVREEVPRLRTK